MSTYHYHCRAGWIKLNGENAKLSSVDLLNDFQGSEVFRDHSLTHYARMLDRYFSGSSISDQNWPLCYASSSEFKRSVHEELQKLSFGELISYGELAQRINKPGAARAIGQSLGGNPVPIFVPCHRVIRGDERLGGFSAGKVWKKALLRNEGHQVTDNKIMR